MTEKAIIDAYARIRTIDQTIPDDVLDFMKDSAIKNLRQQTFKVSYQTLSDKTLSQAFHILYGNEWHKKWPEKNKAEEMRSIFKEGTQPCRPFQDWVNCINFLANQIQ